MSTFLQLVAEVHREGRFSGSAPTTLQSATGQALDLAMWVRDAYREIQLKNDGRWRWLRKRFTLTTAASDGIYAFGDVTDDATAAPIARFRDWRVEDRYNPPKIYLTSSGVSGQRYLVWKDWDYFQQIYRFGTQNDAPPVHISVDQNSNICLGPVPNDVFTVQGEYWRSPQILTADDDTPEMPSMHHQAIVWEAIGKAGSAHISPELLHRARNEGGRYMSALQLDQSEARRQFRKARPMA